MTKKFQQPPRKRQFDKLADQMTETVINKSLKKKLRPKNPKTAPPPKYRNLNWQAPL